MATPKKTKKAPASKKPAAKKAPASFNGIFAPFHSAQVCREWLDSNKLLDTSRKIEKDAGGLLFPLVSGAKLPAKNKLPKDCELLNYEFVEKQARGGLKERLLALGIVAPEDADELVGSFDLIGNIAIVQIRPPLQNKAKAIAQAILDSNPNVKTVLQKAGAREGEWRATPVEWLAGENTTHTTHRESGVSMKVDIATCYFSRLSTERIRLSNLVQASEKIVIPFAGVGPFVLVIAKQHPDATVVGVELNPDASKLFAENVTLNKLTNANAVHGDAKAILAEKKFCGCADRVIAPLPHSAKEFLPEMIGVLKKGGVLHYYGFVPTVKKFARDLPGEPPGARFEPLIEDVRREAKKQGRKLTVLLAKPVRPYSAAIDQAVIDARID